MNKGTIETLHKQVEELQYLLELLNTMTSKEARKYIEQAVLASVRDIYHTVFGKQESQIRKSTKPKETKEQPKKMRKRDRERMERVLRVFRESNERLTLSQLAKAARVTKKTAQKILEDAGYKVEWEFIKAVSK